MGPELIAITLLWATPESGIPKHQQPQCLSSDGGIESDGGGDDGGIESDGGSVDAPSDAPAGGSGGMSGSGGTGGTTPCNGVLPPGYYPCGPCPAGYTGTHFCSEGYTGVCVCTNTSYGNGGCACDLAAQSGPPEIALVVLISLVLVRARMSRRRQSSQE